MAQNFVLGGSKSVEGWLNLGGQHGSLEHNMQYIIDYNYRPFKGISKLVFERIILDEENAVAIVAWSPKCR